MLPENLILRQIELGPLNNFLYILGDKATRQGAIVDPAWDVPRLIREAEKENLTITGIYLTHTHPDHINGLNEILSHYNVPVYVNEYEADFIADGQKEIIALEDGEAVPLGNISFETIHLPGHSPGSQGFLYQNILLSGDCLFIDGCGRCDLPGSDPRAQYHSLYDTLMALPEETVIFSGHNYGPTPYATIGEQKQTNPYLTCSSEEEFLQTRMGIIS